MTGITCAIAGSYVTSTGISTYNFFTTSAPTGITTRPADSFTYQYDWSASQGLRTAGDAQNDFVYTVQSTASYTGSFLVQVSYQVIDTTETDPSIAIWPVANGRDSPYWTWAPNPSRIAYSVDSGAVPYLFGGPSNFYVEGDPYSYTSLAWYTLHMWHEPTQSRTRALQTTGQNDWTISGSQVGGSTLILSQYYSGSTPLYIGIASDADGRSLGSGCNFSGMRITQL